MIKMRKWIVKDRWIENGDVRIYYDAIVKEGNVIKVYLMDMLVAEFGKGELLQRVF